MTITDNVAVETRERNSTGIRRIELWSFVVSVFALVLTQAPPVSNWFVGEAIDVRTSRSIGIGTHLGKLAVRFTLDLRNIGGRGLEVNEIECFLRKSTGESIAIPIKTYYHPGDGVEFGFVPVSLEPGSRLTLEVGGYSTRTEDESEAMSRLDQEIIESIFDKQAGVPYQERKTFEADEAAVKRAKEFFDSHFPLSQGEYNLVVAVKSAKGGLLKVLAYPIVIYPYQLEILRGRVDRYRWGMIGLNHIISDPMGDLFIDLNSPLPEEEANALYPMK